jgi:gas vesicle protein
MDYKNGKIYCIRSHKTDLIYIGSTTQPLYKRLNTHKRMYKAFLKTGKRDTSSYKIFELDESPYIELICNCPCKDKNELNREEGKYIREIECVNRCVAGRTGKEYRQENKEQVAKYIKKYQQEHKEELKKYNQKRYQDGKEEIKERVKKYRQEHKEEIKKRTSEKITCECGTVINRSSKTRHERTIKHKKFIEENN